MEGIKEYALMQKWKPDRFQSIINFPVWGQLMRQLRYCTIRQLCKQAMHPWARPMCAWRGEGGDEKRVWTALNRSNVTSSEPDLRSSHSSVWSAQSTGSLGPGTTQPRPAHPFAASFKQCTPFKVRLDVVFVWSQIIMVFTSPYL